MADRDSIFANIEKDYYIEGYGYIPTDASIKDAMDENGRQMCLDLLEYMAKNGIECVDSIKGYLFYYRGQYLTKEQLFENFI